MSKSQGLPHEDGGLWCSLRKLHHPLQRAARGQDKRVGWFTRAPHAVQHVTVTDPGSALQSALPRDWNVGAYKGACSCSGNEGEFECLVLLQRHMAVDQLSLDRQIQLVVVE